MAQGYQCVIHLTFGSNSVTLRSIYYLLDWRIRNKKRRKRILVNSNIESILDSDETICATKTCGMNRYTLRNGDKAVTYGRLLGQYNARVNRGENRVS